MLSKPTVVDLFCGCGGISWGLAQAGFDILAGVDFWQPALKTFALNHRKTLPIFADLTELTPLELLKRLSLERGMIDCLVGGPPCQGFSKNVPASYRFLADPRNQLMKTFLDFVKFLYPRTVIIENVAEIYNAFDGKIRHEIVDSLQNLGYTVAVKNILAADYGVPQKRRRCFFLASRTGTAPYFPDATFAEYSSHTLFQQIFPYISAWAAISDLPPLANGEGFFAMPYLQPPQNDYQSLMRYQSAEIYDHITRRLNPKQFARVSSLRAGEGMQDLPEHLRPKSGYSGAYGRLDFDQPAPTITRWVFHPGSGRFCHPQQDRLLTIREVARLQSFSDIFHFTGTYIQKSHQLGNAVPPLVAKILGEAIKVCLGLPSIN